MKKNVWQLFVIPVLLLGCVATQQTVKSNGVKSSSSDTGSILPPGVEIQSNPKLLPQNIKKIAVPTFVNNTVQYGLEEKLTLQVRQEFLRNGRLELVDDKTADGKLVGEIGRYILEPLTYDINHVVEEYKLWILINLKFYEKDAGTGTWKESPLWEEKNLEGMYRFFAATKPGGSTEEDARNIIWDRLARDIVIRTVKGFGTVSGTSEQKVPKD